MMWDVECEMWNVGCGMSEYIGTSEILLTIITLNPFTGNTDAVHRISTCFKPETLFTALQKQ